MPRFGDGAFDMRELLRRLAEQVVNAVMDAEADRLCGGGANSRNGYRERSLFPEAVLERYQRVDRALVAAVAEMYATGTSTRKVQRVAEKMGVSRLSKDQVSAIASSLDADIEELCGRPLDGSPVPYVWLDGPHRLLQRVQEEGLAPEAQRWVHADAIMDRFAHSVVWVDMGEASMRQHRGQAGCKL